MDKSQETTIKAFLVALAVVVAVAAFLRLSYHAQAAETITIEQATSTGYTGYDSPNPNVLGQSFTAVSGSISAFAFYVINDGWTTPTSSTIAIALCRGNPDYHYATSTYLGTFTPGFGYAADCGEMETIWSEVDVEDARKVLTGGWLKVSIPPQQLNVDEWYTVIIVGYSPSYNTYWYFNDPSVYSGGQAVMHGTSSKDLIFRVYSDDEAAYDPDPLPITWSGWPAYTGNSPNYVFNSKPNCLINSSCNLAYYWYSGEYCLTGVPCGPEAIGDTIDMYKQFLDGSLGLFVGSTTVAYDTGTTSKGTVGVIAETIPHKQNYCAVITDPHGVYATKTICGIQANWITQHELDIIYAKEECIGNAASSTVCDEDDSGASWYDFSCGLKKFANWAFTPSQTVCEDWALLMMDLDDQFPINIYRTAQGKLDEVNESNSTTTLVLPLYWAGQNTGVNILDASAIEASPAGNLFDYVYLWLEYLMWALATWYFIVRVLRVKDTKKLS